MQIAKAVSTAMRELTTPAPQPLISSVKFAEWLGLQTFGDRELIKLVDGCAEWAAALKARQAPRWISIIGSCGTGKTHCANKLWTWAKERVDWGRCSYIEHPIYWPDFVQQLRAGDRFGCREDMKRWPVLFLDDVGAERDPSGFASEELNTLLGCRMDRWTILTSNLNMERLAAIDQRIASRMVRAPNICVGVNTKDFAAR